MRNLLLLIVLCLAAYWLYERYLNPGSVPAPEGMPTPGQQPSPSKSASSGFAMPDPVAWKVIERSDRWNVEIVIVALVDGTRWRVEARSFPSGRTIVSIFDGSRFVSSDPAVTAAKVDPSTQLRSVYQELNTEKPVAIDVRDGCSCWEFIDGPDANGAKGELWIDRQTHFPVLLVEWLYNGARVEEHCRMLKSDFSILGLTCFDTGNTAPMLDPFLTP